jgi:hypothetical protein
MFFWVLPPVETLKIFSLPLGMTIIGLTGKNGGQMAELCDIEIRVPWFEYADRIQEIHIKVIHALIAGIEKGLEK